MSISFRKMNYKKENWDERLRRFFFLPIAHLFSLGKNNSPFLCLTVFLLGLQVLPTSLYSHQDFIWKICSTKPNFNCSSYQLNFSFSSSISIFEFNYSHVAASSFVNKLAISLLISQHWLAECLRIHQNLNGKHVLKERKEKGRAILCMLIHKACKN